MSAPQRTSKGSNTRAVACPSLSTREDHRFAIQANLIRLPGMLPSSIAATAQCCDCEASGGVFNTSSNVGVDAGPLCCMGDVEVRESTSTTTSVVDSVCPSASICRDCGGPGSTPAIDIPTPAPGGQPATVCTTDDDCATDAANPYCNVGVNSTCTSLLPDGADCTISSDCQRGCLDTMVCGALSTDAACNNDIECESGTCLVSNASSPHTSCCTIACSGS